jgi:hypothetical protein
MERAKGIEPLKDSRQTGLQSPCNDPKAIDSIFTDMASFWCAIVRLESQSFLRNQLCPSHNVEE